MKIITLKQPWASLIAYGYKKYEFRSWNTKYRGEILIHAGKGVDKDAMKKYSSLNLDYPKSKIVAKVKIEDVIKLDSNSSKEICDENNFIYGNKIHDGYAFKLTNIEKLDLDIEVIGKLGIWNIDINL